MRNSLLLSALAFVCLTKLSFSTVYADEVVDFSIDLCNQKHGYKVDLPGKSTVIHIQGLHHSSLFGKEYNEDGEEVSTGFVSKVMNFLYYYKFQWSEVTLRFYDDEGELVDRDEMILGEGNTVEEAIGKRDRRNPVDHIVKQATNLLTWPIQIMTGEIKNMFSFRSKEQILTDTSSRKATATYKRNPYEEIYVAIKQDSVHGRNDGQTHYGRDAAAVSCSINTIAIQFPVLLLLGTYAAVNAEALATSWWILYVGGSAIGVIVAITLITYFVYRNRDNKLILGSFGISVMFGGAATWFHDALSHFLEQTVGAPWLADYAWVLPILIIFLSIVTTVFFCLRLRGNTTNEKKISLHTLAYIIRAVGVILVYNAFQTRSVGIAAAAMTVLPCFFVSMFQWLEDTANYILSWFQMVGCFKGRRFTCISSFRNRYGCRRVDVIGDAIREEEVKEQSTTPTEETTTKGTPTARTPGSNKKRRSSTGGLTAAEVSRLIKHAGTDASKLNNLTEFLDVIHQTETETSDHSDDDSEPEPAPRVPQGNTSSLRRRPSVAR